MINHYVIVQDVYKSDIYFGICRDC